RRIRKNESKDFVTIIDFIGNYKNNYLIPIALSGDHSQNKDNIRRRTLETDYIKGVSTINFEQIAKEKIFESINTNNLTTLKILRDAYNALKNRIGRMPLLEDFIVHHSVDPLVIVQKYNNYYSFLLKMKEDLPLLRDAEQQALNMFSLEVLNRKRMHEIMLLDQLLKNKKIHLSHYKKCLQQMNCIVDDNDLNSVQRIFDLRFFTEANRKKYGNEPIIVKNEQNEFHFSEHIQE